MIKSMTGYGKAEAILEHGKLTVEFRSVNGKNADIAIKSSLLPKDREIQVRKAIAEKLTRGSIDMFLTWEPNAASGAAAINSGLALEYFRQLKNLTCEMGSPNVGLDKISAAILACNIAKMPEVMESGRTSAGVFMSMSICGARKNPRADMSTPQTAPKAMFVWTAASMAL